MYKLLLKIVQERIELLRKPKNTAPVNIQARVLGGETDIGSRLVSSQLGEESGLYERIKHIEKQIANESVEIGVIFDRQGAITVVRKGTVNSVIFSSQEEALAVGNIVTHNHPYNNYFSDLDLSFAHKINVLEIRVVAGKKVHRLVRPAQGWNWEPVEELWDSLERKVEHRRKQKQISAAQAQKDWLKIGELVTRKLSLFTEPEIL